MTNEKIQQTILKEWENFKKTDGFDKTMCTFDKACDFEEFFNELDSNLILKHIHLCPEFCDSISNDISSFLNYIKDGFNTFVFNELEHEAFDFDFFLVKEKQCCNNDIDLDSIS